MVIVCIDSVGRVQHQHQARRLLPQLLAGYTVTVEGPLMDGYPVDKELEERSVAPLLLHLPGPATVRFP